MNSLIVILLIFALLAFWWDSVGAKERAREWARLRCKENQLQYLDDTVALIKIRLRRNAMGRLCFHRCFKFEFSSNDYNRFSGTIEMLGQRLDKVEMDAYPVGDKYH